MVVPALKRAIDAACERKEASWPILMNARDGDLLKLKLALDRGVPTHPYAAWVAAENGHVMCLKALLEHGVQPSLLEMRGAIVNDHLDCLKALVEHGIPISPSCMIYATRRNRKDVKILRYLIKQGATIDEAYLGLGSTNYKNSRMPFDQRQTVFLYATKQVIKHGGVIDNKIERCLVPMCEQRSSGEPTLCGLHASSCRGELLKLGLNGDVAGLITQFV